MSKHFLSIYKQSSYCWG